MFTVFTLPGDRYGGQHDRDVIKPEAIEYLLVPAAANVHRYCTLRSMSVAVAYWPNVDAIYVTIETWRRVRNESPIATTVPISKARDTLEDILNGMILDILPSDNLKR